MLLAMCADLATNKADNYLTYLPSLIVDLGGELSGGSQNQGHWILLTLITTLKQSTMSKSSAHIFRCMVSCLGCKDDQSLADFKLR